MAVEIVPYRANWPSEFAAIAGAFRRWLGELALRIDHIGSTSVPGLAAKDIIDVQIAVAAFDDRVLAALTALGFTRIERIRRDHCPPLANPTAAEWEKWYFAPPAGQRRTNTTCACWAGPTSATRSCFATFCAATLPPRPRTRSLSGAWRRTWPIRTPIPT